MIILLLTILAIALLFIFAGLLLSPRSSEPTQRGISYAARGGGGGMRAPTRSGARRTGPAMTRSQYVAGVRRASRSYTQDLQRSPWENFMETVNIERLFRPHVGDKTPWLGLTLILVALFIVSLLLLKSLLPDATVIGATWPDVAVSASPPTSSTVAKNSSPDNPFASLSGASGALVRLPQLDAAQYNSQQDYNTWAYSACSTASMTEVINSYGHTYRIADILKVEAGIHEITPDLGLIEPVGIDRTVAQFGFSTYWLKNPSLDDVIGVATKGHPVIVGFPPDRWSGGHLLVVRGGDSKYVYLADSSRLNMQAMARATFMKYWAGFAAVVMPK